ncbi:hypothetical protein Tco_0360041 [Tanacetum coccineum]
MGFRMKLVQGATPICEGSCRLTSLERQEVWNDSRSCRVSVGSNGNLLWEVSVLLGRKKGGVRVAREDDCGFTKGREDVREVFQQRGSGAKRKLSRCGRNQMGNEPILALPEGADDFVVYYDARSKDLKACLEKREKFDFEAKCHLGKANVDVVPWSEANNEFEIDVRRSDLVLMSRVVKSRDEIFSRWGYYDNRGLSRFGAGVIHFKKGIAKYAKVSSTPQKYLDLDSSYFIQEIILLSLIPLSHGSFDVLVGMDRLSKRKFGIVCHGKVVRIPLEGDEILQVHSERTQGVVKTLMNTKVDEPKLSDLVHRAMPVAKSPYRLAPLEMQELSEQLQELQDDWFHRTSHFPLGSTRVVSSDKDRIGLLQGKANVVIEALSRKERVKPRRVRAMAMIIQYGVRGMILTAQSEAFKQENGMMRTVVMDEAHASRFRWMIYFVVLADAAESVSDAIRFEYCLASSSGWTKSPVLWAEIGESSLIGPELVQETTDKVVLIKEKLKAARDRQKSCADNRRKPVLEFDGRRTGYAKRFAWKWCNSLWEKGVIAAMHYPVVGIAKWLAVRYSWKVSLNSQCNLKFNMGYGRTT